ncbi:hypothetical protein HX793_14970 [Pseudomonas reactans]|uniref:hypothetical protein n=1 Tax=Pseudomonas reactans TaxID=117680 RepID=UPI0015A1E0D2|nr:hypothetical protein [Pseudomonas reactans]NWC87998.1 hypothetical protein [Pseudomonas reactans]NWD31075.1 hypothetical protein [Pseudomonas reactans]NWF13738.1 hypothetical protein [Pseudomonas reactans]
MLLKTLMSYDVRHSAINQLWRLFSGPLLLLLVPIYLSAEAQGYWYTFISLAALAVFADMGFSSILLLFSSHEFAHLTFNPDKTLAGDTKHLVRLATLGRFALKWSVTMAVVVFPLVLITGYFFLNSKGSAINWQLPWLIYGVASILVFLNSMLLSFIEGCDSVGDVQKIRFYISLSTVAVTALLLICGDQLYALAIALLSGALTGLFLIGYRYKKMLQQLYRVGKDNHHSWAPEIMPLMWRFAVSWISGYFILSIFTPVAFHFYGAVEAGQVGLSMAICMALFSIANIWVSISTPKMNMYVAQQDYPALNSTFKRALLLATLTYMLGLATLFAGVELLKDYLPIANRLLSPASLALVGFGWLIQLWINSMAVYMRAHKREPLVVASVVQGLYVAATTLTIAINLPFEYLFLGFFTALCLVMPWVFWIFKNFKRSYL